MRLLLVEDDVMIGNSLRQGLHQDGFVVDWIQDGEAAEVALSTTAYALILLDLGLPKRSGMDILATLRQRHDPTPVIILTARDGVADRVRGLDSGADDYLVKPFTLDELAARIRAVYRRHQGQASSLITYGDLTLDPATYRVTQGGVDVTLSGREFAVLHALLERPGTVLSRAQLEERLYGWDDELMSNTIEVYIHHVRKKLGSTLIRNVRGVGYMVQKAP